jgi:hypothetical protein
MVIDIESPASWVDDALSWREREKIHNARLVARLMQPSAARLSPYRSGALQGMQSKRLLIISREINENTQIPFSYFSRACDI